jgi:hypothetical protein
MEGKGQFVNEFVLDISLLMEDVKPVAVDGLRDGLGPPGHGE